MTNLGSVEPFGTFLVTQSFTDVEGNEIIPDSIVWSLTDSYGSIVNSRENVVVATPAQEITVLLSNLDFNPEEEKTRIITFEAEYTSVTYGTGLKTSSQYEISISSWVEPEPLPST